MVENYKSFDGSKNNPTEDKLRKEMSHNTNISKSASTGLTDFKLSLDKRFRDSQDSFNAIFEKSPFGSQVLSKHLFVLQANDALVKLLGLKIKSDIVGTSILQYVHPDHKKDWQLLQNSLWVEEHAPVSFETCLVRPDGTSTWCEVTPILYQEDGEGFSYTILEDISKRKLDEEQIKKSEANLRNILESTDSGYVLYDQDCRIITYNAVAQNFAKRLYNKTLVNGGYMFDYFPKDRHDNLRHITEKVIKGGEVSYEILIDSGSEERWMDVKWLNVKNGEDKNWGFILASKDITEQKVAAAEREKMTVDLINRNKNLEQFTNITSHNLRAPVANIIGLLQVMEEMDFNEEDQKEMLDGIMQSAKNLDMVINDINQILQIKDLQNEVKQDVYFHQMVSSIETSISNVITKERVKITCDFTEASHLFVTRSYLYSVFYNFILNSIKYRRVGVDPEISITSRHLGNEVALVFIDNGKGIDLARNGKNLFGLYKRFDTTVEGKGLGLFMVKAQIEAMGGNISVESEPGRGTTFTVSLPLDR